MSNTPVDCGNCQNNILGATFAGKPPQRFCSRRIITFPHAKIFCTGFKPIEEKEVSAKVKHQRAVANKPPATPAKPEPHYNDPVHLVVYVDRKKKDALESYIYLP